MTVGKMWLQNMTRRKMWLPNMTGRSPGTFPFVPYEDIRRSHPLTCKLSRAVFIILGCPKKKYMTVGKMWLQNMTRRKMWLPNMTGRSPGTFPFVPYEDIRPSHPLYTVQLANMTAEYDCQSHCQIWPPPTILPSQNVTAGSRLSPPVTFSQS